MLLLMPSLRVRNVALLASVVVTGALSAYCGGTDATSTFEVPAETDGSTLPPGFGSCDGCALGPDGAVTPAAAVCGDGRITGKKGCDDGNEKSGDGCDATCNVELGWVCPNPGLRCEAASCGDGVVAGAEECDAPKGMTVAGCSATCKIEPGFDCDPKNLTCMPVVCGDGVIQRGETCEDGNDLPFDGCFKCQKETSCTSGTCKAQCGDSQRFAGEGCDDDNRAPGDGCSARCAIDRGMGVMALTAFHLSEAHSDPLKNGATHTECRVAASPTVVNKNNAIRPIGMVTMAQPMMYNWACQLLRRHRIPRAIVASFARRNAPRFSSPIATPRSFLPSDAIAF